MTVVPRQPANVWEQENNNSFSRVTRGFNFQIHDGVFNEETNQLEFKQGGNTIKIRVMNRNEIISQIH